jgi:pimeloyl-ACP methyl ester carboxylesterase
MPELAGVEHSYVDVPGVRLHVAEAGSGPPLVLLHGWPQHWWEWRGLIPGLAERHRVICPDMRGFGWSDVPREGYEKAQLARDVVALLEALDIDRAGLIGHDWGGYAGFLLCLSNPERVTRYLALNTGHPLGRPALRKALALWRFWYQLVLSVPGLGPRVVGSPRLMRAIFDRAVKVPFHEFEPFLAQFREPERAWATGELYRSFLLREAGPLLSGRQFAGARLTTPTLFLHGTADPAIRPELLRGFEGQADDMRLELVEGAGHFIADERPAMVLGRALEFFG